MAVFSVLALLSTACAAASDWVSFDPRTPEDGPSATPTSTVDSETTGPGQRSSRHLWGPLGEPGVGGRVTALAVDPSDARRVLVGGDMLGIGVSIDGGATWQSTAGLSHTEVGRITFHPTVPGEVWAATMGGPFVSNDGGHTWSARRDGLPAAQPLGYAAPFEEVLFDPRDPDHLIGLGGSHRQWEAPEPTGWGGVWESTDHGRQWQLLTTLRPDDAGTATGVNIIDGVWLKDGTLMAVGLNQGIFRSEDGGVTWMASSTGLTQTPVRELAAHPTKPEVLWAAVAGRWQDEQARPGGIWRSNDGGRSWVESSRGLDQLPPATFQAGDGTPGGDRGSPPGAEFLPTYRTVAVAPTNPDLLLTANVAFGRQAVFRSEDGGDSWAEVVSSRSSNRPGTAYSTPIGADVSVFAPTDANVAFLGNEEFVLATTNAGRSWRDVTSDTFEDGTSAGRGYSGLVANGVQFGPRPGEIMVCGFDGANPLTSLDGGRRWRRPMVGIDEWGGCVDSGYSRAAPGRRHVLLGQAGIFGGVGTIEADGSTRLALGPSAGLPARFSQSGSDGSLEVVTGEDGTETVAVTVGGVLYRSVDEADRYEIADGAPWLGPLAAAVGQPGVLYGAGPDGVYRSPDAGRTWVALQGPSAAVRLVHSPADQGLYAVVWRSQGAGVWRYDELGDARWTVVLDQAASHDLAVDPADPAHLMVATNDHPYRDLTASVGMVESFDRGLTWTDTNDGLPMARVAVVAFDPMTPGRVVIGTYGRGFFERTATCGNHTDPETRC